MARNESLFIKRNIAVKNRYDTLYNKLRKRHDDVIKILENEFFITEKTLLKILFPTDKKKVNS